MRSAPEAIRVICGQRAAQLVDLPLHRFDGFHTVRGEIGTVAHLLQDTQRQLLIHHVVFGQQDAQRMPRRRVQEVRRGRHRGHDLGGRVVGEQSDKRVVQLGLANRLGEIRCQQLLVVADLAPAQRAEQHERQRAIALADLPGERHAVHLGHVHVHDREIEDSASFEPAQRGE